MSDRSSWPPRAGFLLQAPVRAAGAVATPAAPCAALGLPAALRAVNLPSRLFLQRSSHLLLSRGPSSVQGCRAPTLPLENGNGMRAGERSDPKPMGRDQRDSGRAALQTNPREPLRVCRQRLKRGRENQAKAVWALTPEESRGYSRGRPGEEAWVSVLCPVSFLGPEHLQSACPSSLQAGMRSKPMGQDCKFGGHEKSSQLVSSSRSRLPSPTPGQRGTPERPFCHPQPKRGY